MSALLALAGLALIGILALAIYLASASHDKPIKCPPGWRPNTGYLQHGCIPR